jgi:MFS transporter, PPP family, 3-phenylpropionic acid transporter
MTATKAHFNFKILFFMYFFFFGGIGIYMTFINVYYSTMGMSGFQIGMIATATGLVSFGGAALWGYLSDRTGHVRWILAGTSLGTALLALLTQFAHSFTAFILLASVFALFNSGLFTLTDSTALILLGDKAADYGRYRMGGSIGYIITSAGGGFLFQAIGLNWMFAAYALVCLLFCLIVLPIPRLPIRLASQAGGALGSMMRKRSWLIFAGTVFLVWLATSGLISFLSVTIKALGGSDSLVGLTSAAAALAEIPFMATNSWFLRRFGAKPLIWFSLIFYILRIFLYSLLKVPGWAIGVNMLNGPSFVLMWTGAINYAARMAPEGMKATAQGLISSTTSLSSVAGTLLSGWLFDQVGPTAIYRVLSLFCVAAFILFSLDMRGKQSADPQPLQEAL